MNQEILEAINNLAIETKELRIEVKKLKEINELLKTDVYTLKEYVSTLE
tara:strand:+ start:312 stop:458 length:147 start_codon:yes stop_codon:yes gene_type:complete